MGKIENHKFTIQDAFQQNFYTVPDYQREYIWTDREVAKLLDDFDEQLDATDREYFIGMVLVSASGPNRFDVIDGQQRLTTLFLLLCALRRRLAPLEDVEPLLADTLVDVLRSFGKDRDLGEARPALPRCCRRYRSPRQFDLRSAIASVRVARRAHPDRPVPSTFSSRRTNRSCGTSTTTTELMTRSRGTGAFLPTAWSLFRSRPTCSLALKIFETINERGVGLSPMDLLKNLLFTNVKPEQFPSRWRGRRSRNPSRWARRSPFGSCAIFLWLHIR